MQDHSAPAHASTRARLCTHKSTRTKERRTKATILTCIVTNKGARSMQTHTHAHTHMHAYTHTRTHTHIHTRTSTHLHHLDPLRQHCPPWHLLVLLILIWELLPGRTCTGSHTQTYTNAHQTGPPLLFVMRPPTETAKVERAFCLNAEFVGLARTVYVRRI